MANEVIKLKRGPKGSMPTVKEAGAILIATDTGEAYVDDSSTSRVQLKDSTKLPLSGGNLSGPLNLGANKATSSAVPTADNDLVNFKALKDLHPGAIIESTTVASYNASTKALTLTAVSGLAGMKDVLLLVTGFSKLADATISIDTVVPASGLTYTAASTLTLKKTADFAIFKYNGTNVSLIHSGNINVSADESAISATASGTDVSIEHKNILQTGAAGTAYGPTATKKLSYGETIKIPQVTPGVKGHLQSVKEFQLTLPDAPSIPDIDLTSLAIGLCTTAAATSAKAITLPKIPAVGNSFILSLINGNTATTPTLTINGTSVTFTGYTSKDILCPAKTLWLLKMDTASSISFSANLSANPVGESDNPVLVNTATGIVKHKDDVAIASAGPTSNASPGFGGTINIPQVSRDKYGHVGSLTNRVITLPSAPTIPEYTSGNDAIGINNHVITHKAYTGRSGGPTANATPGFGGTFKVPQVVSDATGHITGVTDRVITLPAAPDIPEQTKYTAGDVINISATNEISHDTYAAKTGGPTANASLAFGGTFKVPQVTSDEFGHVTGVTDRVITLPASPAIPDPIEYSPGSGLSLVGNVFSHNLYASQLGGPDANKSVGFGGTFTVPRVESDGLGHVTDIIDMTITLPAAPTPYTHPAYTARNSGLYKITVDNKGHVSAVTAVAKADITGLGIPAQDTTYSAMKGATASAAGNAGLAPAPAAGASNRYLRSDGTWSVPPDTDTKYTHPAYTPRTSGLYKITVDSTGHVSAVAAVTKADITALGIPGTDTNTTYSAMKGATTSAAGTAGLAPAPAAGAANRYLRSDGTWQVPPDTNTVYSHPVYTSRSGGPTANASPAHGRSFTVPQVTSDSSGHVTAVTNRTITLPAAPVSTSAAVADSAVQFRNIVVVPKGTDPATVNCPVGTIIMVKES